MEVRSFKVIETPLFITPQTTRNNNMNKIILTIIVIAGIASTVFYYQNQSIDTVPVVPEVADIKSNSTQIDDELSSDFEDDGSLAQDQSAQSPEVVNTEREEPGRSATANGELEEALGLAEKTREDAEEALRVVEMELTALEAQLDDIVDRGDEPVDVQDETLDTFQAIFAEYQDTIKIYEEAAAQEEWIQSKIEESGL